MKLLWRRVDGDIKSTLSTGISSIDIGSTHCNSSALREFSTTGMFLSPSTQSWSSSRSVLHRRKRCYNQVSQQKRLS